MTYNLSACASHHPSQEYPYKGLFNKRTLQSLAEHDGCSLSVCAPVPYAPPVGPYSDYRKVPKYESFSEYNAIRPRFPHIMPKSLFYSITGELFKAVIKRTTDSLTGDIIHGCHVYPDGYGLTEVADSNEVPLTVTCHGYFLNNYGNLPIGVAKRVRKTLQRANHVFCVSDALAEKARSIIKDTTVSTIPIGANPRHFPTGQEENLRANYSVDLDTTVVLYCGQFIERKGVDDIIEALNQFPEENVEYVFVGHRGDLLSNLRSISARDDTPDGIRIFSGVDSEILRDWYAIADLLLLPSYEEGRPTVIYEAMAAETAVLSTSIEGVSEQVVDGETGVLIPSGDLSALVAALERLVENRNDLKSMGEQGKQRLLSNGWTWRDHANRIVDTHEQLL